MLKKITSILLVLTFLVAAPTTALATGVSNTPPSVGIIFDYDNAIDSSGWVMVNVDLHETFNLRSKIVGSIAPYTFVHIHDVHTILGVTWLEISPANTGSPRGWVESKHVT